MASILLNELDEMYKKKTAADMASLDSAYQQNVSGVENTRSKITPMFTDARNQVAGQSAVQQGNFNEYANATGLNSGAGGQAQLAFGTTLQNNLGALNKEESSKLSDLDLQLNNIKTQYANDAARLKADGDWQALNAKYQQMQADQQAAIEQYRYDESLGLQKDATAYDRAVAAANASGVYDSMAAWGWKPDEIASANARAKPTSSGGGGGGSSGVSKPTLTAAQTLAAINDGVTTPAVLSAYEYYYGQAYGDTGTSGVAAATSGTPDNPVAADRYIQGAMRSAGARGFNANTITSNLSSMLQQGTITENDVIYILNALGLS